MRAKGLAGLGGVVLTVEILRAKQAGRAIEPPPAPAPHRVVNLMEALRASLATADKKPAALEAEMPAAAKARPRTAAKRKAGS